MKHIGFDRSEELYGATSLLDGFEPDRRGWHLDNFQTDAIAYQDSGHAAYGDVVILDNVSFHNSGRAKQLVKTKRA